MKYLADKLHKISEGELFVVNLDKAIVLRGQSGLDDVRVAT